MSAAAEPGAPPGARLEAGVWVCASVAAAEADGLARGLAGARDADLVEIRLDALPEAPGRAALAGLFRRALVPVIATCRPVWQAGGFSGDEAARRALLEMALDAGARWIDVELEADWAEEAVGSRPDRVLLSHHWDTPEPPDLEARLRRMIELRPAIAKLVSPAERGRQALALIAAAERLHEAGIVPACFAMGEGGRASRLLSPARAGGVLYVAPAGQGGTAPGQWPLGTVRHALKVGRWRPGMSIYAVIGEPVEHSLSPTIFNAAFAAAGRPALYLPLPGADLDDSLAAATAAGACGLSVTMPFKEQVAERCSRLEGLAARVGTVNTLVADDGGWIGHNTDGPAVVDALASHLGLDGARVLIVGAGGAARGAAAALVEAGAEVVLANRTAERAVELAAELGCRTLALEEVERERFAALVNATPVGMDGTARVPVSTAGLQGDEVVMEMIYRPAETELLRQAGARGCTLVPGIEMFVRQAEAQHRIWTREPPPPGSLRKAAMASLGG